MHVLGGASAEPRKQDKPVHRPVAARHVASHKQTSGDAASTHRTAINSLQRPPARPPAGPCTAEAGSPGLEGTPFQPVCASPTSAAPPAGWRAKGREASSAGPRVPARASFPARLRARAQRRVSGTPRRRPAHPARSQRSHPPPLVARPRRIPCKRDRSSTGKDWVQECGNTTRSSYRWARGAQRGPGRGAHGESPAAVAVAARRRGPSGAPQAVEGIPTLAGDGMDPETRASRWVAG